jgi:choline kinase
VTRAFILAAGQGTRLRPLTDDLPKCLVPLAGRPLLDRQAEVLRAAGVEDIVVVSGYRADRIREKGYRCILNKRFAATNMVTTLFTARDEFGSSDDLIISYGDIVYQRENLDTLLGCRAPIAVMVDRDWRKYWDLRFEDPLSDAESLLVDDSGSLLELGKKSDSYEKIQGQYTGLIKVDRDHIARLSEFYDSLDRDAIYDGNDFDNMYMTSFLQALIDAGWGVKAAFVSNGWLEIDAVSDLELYESLEEKGELAALCRLV